MPIPLLAQLGITLAAGLIQHKQEQEDHKKGTAKHLAKTKQAILARRAARAGDSGYMQMALDAHDSRPKKPPSQVGNILGGMGMALLNRQEAPTNGFQSSSSFGDWGDERDEYERLKG